MCHLNVHFEQNPFSCQHEQEEKPIQDQAVSWELNGLTHQQQPSLKKSLFLKISDKKNYTCSIVRQALAQSFYFSAIEEFFRI